MSRSILAAGLLGGAAIWGASIIAPSAWQTPSAFASVAMVAFVVLHRSWRKVIGATSPGPRRMLQGVLILVAGVGAVLGLLDLGYVPSFCALVVIALIVLTAVWNAPSVSDATQANAADGAAERTDEAASK